MTRLGLAIACALGCGASAPPSAPPRTVQLNATGAMVDLEAATVPGYVTVIDFWAEWCKNCVSATGRLAVQTAGEPRIVIRKVDVGEGDTPVAKACKIGPLPHFLIYDKHRRLRHILVASDTLSAADLAKQLLAEP
jgi:thiol-disulfide isomerase/thioredoxin